MGKLKRLDDTKLEVVCPNCGLKMSGYKSLKKNGYFRTQCCPKCESLLI